MKILWVSDSPNSPTGFGTVTAAVCKRLAERGHRVEILGWQNHSITTRWEGIPVHPVRMDIFGSDALLGYLYRFQPDFVITLADVWWMSFIADPPVQRFLDMSGSRWVLYYPIDGAAADGRLPSGWIRMLETADVPVAMSRFGVEVSAACGIEASYVPHGCELDVFRPPPDKDEAKRRLGYEHRFVLLSDARNQPRKLIPRLLDVATEFVRGKDDVVVHIHADPDDSAAASKYYHYQLREDVDALGLGDRVRLTANFRMRNSGGLTLEALAGIYAAADAHLLCSWGEGFGLPTLQAASAGVVPLGVAATATRELVEGHGFAIPVESTIVDEFGIVRHLLDRSAAVASLDLLYHDSEQLADRSRRSREFALNYGWDGIVEEWERVLQAAPPRRKPVRARAFVWNVGERGDPRADLPPSVVSAAQTAFATLPAGAKLSFQMSERRFGEVTAQIKRDAFVEGEAISIPVRLPPAFEGCPRARIGHVLVSPADVSLAGALKRIFPGIAVSLPTPEDDPVGGELLTLEQLLPPLVHYALVVDYAHEAAPGTDLACAALGVPYAGPSRLWPEIPAATRFAQLRRLLTDQGYSQRRRELALECAREAFGDEVIERLRAFALAGQPEPKKEQGRRARQAATPSPPPAIEMFVVRLKRNASAEGHGQIRRRVADLGGLVLLTTRTGTLVVALHPDTKDQLEREALVDFVGGITLDEDSDAALALKKHFARNVVDQLAAKARTPAIAGERR